MQASALLLYWGSYHWAHNLWVLIIYLFSLPVMLPLCFQGSPQTRQWECFLVFGNFSLFKTPFLGWSSLPTSFVSFFVFYIFSYLLLKTMSWFSGCLMSSACIEKLFCGIYSAFKCSFDEFVGEKVVSLSCSSAILGLPPSQWILLEKANLDTLKHKIIKSFLNLTCKDMLPAIVDYKDMDEKGRSVFL